jgi:hypothetical protein
MIGPLRMGFALPVINLAVMTEIYAWMLILDFLLAFDIWPVFFMYNSHPLNSFYPRNLDKGNFSMSWGFHSLFHPRPEDKNRDLSVEIKSQGWELEPEDKNRDPFFKTWSKNQVITFFDPRVKPTRG